MYSIVWKNSAWLGISIMIDIHGNSTSQIAGQLFNDNDICLAILASGAFLSIIMYSILHGYTMCV